MSKEINRSRTDIVISLDQLYKDVIIDIDTAGDMAKTAREELTTNDLTEIFEISTKAQNYEKASPLARILNAIALAFSMGYCKGVAEYSNAIKAYLDGINVDIPER